MDVVRFLSLTTFFCLSTSVFAQQNILVEHPPEYFPGENATIVFPTNFVLGPTTIKIQSQGLIEREGFYGTEFELTVKKARFFNAEGSAFMQDGLRKVQVTINGINYRSESTVKFPLREGDTFENTISKSRPCRENVSKMCVESTVQESCSEVRVVDQGISFVCRSNTRHVRYVMDKDFKWIVSFERLDSG